MENDVSRVEAILNDPSSTARFRVTRSAPRPDLTFSPEALTGLGTDIERWVLSRIMRRWEETGVAAQEMEVEVTVTIDGYRHEEPKTEGKPEGTYSIPDAGHQQAAHDA